MTPDIYDPLIEYRDVFRDRFKQVAERTFAALAAEAHVDVEANRQTCARLYAAERDAASVKSRLNRWKALRALLWVVIIGAAALCLYKHFAEHNLQLPLMAGAAVAILLGILLLYFWVCPKVEALQDALGELTSQADTLRKEAWQQMEPLNRLYDWDVLTRMMTETVPRLEFDPYFTTQRLADLEATYGWDGSFNAERSVVYSHSGLINGNPFVLCRTRKMEMGEKTYRGEKTIHWTTTERGSDGKYHTVHHSQTLVAYVTAPYPEYFEKTRLIYGNTAAPDLTFSRQQSGMAEKIGSLSFRLKRRSLRKKARNLDDGDFAMMTNEDFEVCFDTSDRNNNQQFALLFTPLAQQSMLQLLADQEVGYGDDFHFVKDRMINIIVPAHMQEVDLDMNPARYCAFDYDRAEADFYSTNAEYFRAIYFALAPLLCVPMYQQIRPQSDIYGHDMQRHSAFWEHEALANFWGEKHFAHPECVTHCILKTEQTRTVGDASTITVHAYGYRTEQRLTYVEKWGGDGRMHRVPVYWDEYLPVEGQGRMQMSEDNTPEADATTADGTPALTQTQRLGHINALLQKQGLDVYRRHIASRV